MTSTTTTSSSSAIQKERVIVSSPSSSSSSCSPSSPSSSAEVTTTTTTTTVVPEEYPRGDSVAFPYKTPYPQQVALMDALLQGMMMSRSDSTTTRILCLESPTGTGKSLSLACASLSWLDYQERQQQQQQQDVAAKSLADKTESDSTSPTSTASTNWWNDWKPSNDNDTLCGTLNSNDSLLQKQQEQTKQLETKLEELRSHYQHLPNNVLERRENLLRQAITKHKIEAKRLARRKRKSPKLIQLEYEDESDNDDQEKNNKSRRQRASPLPGTTEWLLSSQYQQPYHHSLDTSSSTSPPPPPPQIIYAARTHSQLTQFVSEIRKTKWAKSLRVVTLASRSQGTCGFIKASQDWTEDCATHRQNKTCTYSHDAPSTATLALHAMTEPTPMEDWIQMGQASRTCTYYATRQAVAKAQLIVVPYPMLVHASTRESIGLTLHENHLILIDEAHNLPLAIANSQSCQVSLSTCQLALAQTTNYTRAYMERLSSRHLHLLGQLKVLLKGFVKAIHNNNKASATDNKKKDTKALWSPSEFLCEHRLDTINLFPIVRYMKESQLSRKLLGFLPKNNNDNDSDTHKNAKATKRKTISPMSLVETLLHTLNYSNADGKLVVTPEKIQYVVLNPAVHAQDDLFTKPHAVCLVGGTLQPFGVLMQELIPSLAQDAQRAQEVIYQMQQQQQTQQSQNGMLHWNTSRTLGVFSCGHVVDKSNVLLQAISRVNGVTVDVRHKTRDTPAVIQAIGVALEKLLKTVPNGVVVFFPSYNYEQVVVQAWKASGQWRRFLQYKSMLVREPKQSKDIDATLDKYSRAAASEKGALLLSVMGGKLSEGINFANELCRCVVVVGLPFPDKSDPLLQEKLRLVANPIGFYTSLCMRSVNQSVGRAIRHAHDYASIVVMDARYAQQDSSIAQGLPAWLTSSTPGWRRPDSTNLQSVTSRVGRFFANKG